MELIPSNVGKVTTCSKKCSSLRRRSANPKAQSLRAYKDAVDRIAAGQLCEKCGRKHGPFVVKDLKATFGDDGELAIDDARAKLWCRQCHLQSIALVGGNANGARLGGIRKT
jgi:5-methylcytosine-specific restriction endonuclease McrA